MESQATAPLGNDLANLGKDVGKSQGARVTGQWGAGSLIFTSFGAFMEVALPHKVHEAWAARPQQSFWEALQPSALVKNMKRRSSLGSSHLRGPQNICDTLHLPGAPPHLWF